MKIRFFMPDTDEGIKLKLKVAELHAVAFIEGIKKLPCEADRKLQLFNTIKAEIRRRAERCCQSEINPIKVSVF